MTSHLDATPTSRRPRFLITIDTEGDNLWARSREITTRNSEYLPRFQTLCEKYGFKPTYLTNYEMVECPRFREFALDAQRRGTAELGMHLHAWNSPPIVPLTNDDFVSHPYLIQFPTQIMRDKIAVLTDRLEEVFGAKMVSHRAGKWAFNEVYARLLEERGYRVDCSVTPHVSWSRNGGSDYTDFPETAYVLDRNDISRAASDEASGGLLELPMTILPAGPLGKRLHRMIKRAPGVARLALNRVAPEAHWLRPNGHNLGSMLGVLRAATRQKRDYVEFMLHSSEFMPGGSPIFETKRAVEVLYDHLERLFSVAALDFQGATLQEYQRDFASVVSPVASR